VLCSTAAAAAGRGEVSFIALTIGFGLSDKRGHGVEVEKIQLAMITLSA